ncbi:hypothetical protein ACFSB1_06965 [Halopseudomonas phragmitis]|uniref:hypothetical protein n=1 Tax=Halopseudomonas phragmitis TaxID=1931241 RepID=UPI0012BAFA8E|nr:hypothetical protein [Halopseudomonas phragmitis]
MALPEPSASSENLEKIIKGLRAVVDEPVLTAALIRYQLDQPMARSQRVPLAVIRSMIEDLSQQLNDPLLMTRAFAQLNYKSKLSWHYLSLQHQNRTGCCPDGAAVHAPWDRSEQHWDKP